MICSLDWEPLKKVTFFDVLAFFLGALVVKFSPVVVRRAWFCSDPEPLLLHQHSLMGEKGISFQMRSCVSELLLQ